MTPDRETLAAAIAPAIDSHYASHHDDWCSDCRSAYSTALDTADALLAGPLAPPPSEGEAGWCHNGHPFVPGRDVDEPGAEDPRWCDTCGEVRRPAPDGEADEAAGRVAAASDALERGGSMYVMIRAPHADGSEPEQPWEALMVADLRLLLAADRDERWQRGYEVGCAAAHDIGCSAVEGERDLWRERAFTAFRLGMEPEEGVDPHIQVTITGG